MSTDNLHTNMTHGADHAAEATKVRDGAGPKVVVSPEPLKVKVISGGQDGADLGGLLAATDLGLPTGGYIPWGCRTEKGANYARAALYGLTETPSNDYAPRTRLNVQGADVTFLFGNASSSGSRLTLKICRDEGKPFAVNLNPMEMRAFILDHKARVINIAGNRESVTPGICEKVRLIVREALGGTR